MTNAARKLPDDALALPMEDHARVTSALLATLDGPADVDAATAWATEIEHRAEKVLAGESDGAPWSEVQARLRARLAPR